MQLQNVLQINGTWVCHHLQQLYYWVSLHENCLVNAGNGPAPSGVLELGHHLEINSSSYFEQGKTCS